MEQKEKENKKPSEKDSSRKPENATKEYNRYMSAGFQMLGPIVVGVVAGQYLDRHYHTKTPVYTIILSSVMIVVALYQLIKQFLKP